MDKLVLYSPTTGGPMKVATPCNKDIGVIDNGDKDNDFIDIDDNDTFDGDADGDLDGDLEKEEKAKCIGEGVSTK